MEWSGVLGVAASMYEYPQKIDTTMTMLLVVLDCGVNNRSLLFQYMPLLNPLSAMADPEKSL